MNSEPIIIGTSVTWGLDLARLCIWLAWGSVMMGALVLCDCPFFYWAGVLFSVIAIVLQKRLTWANTIAFAATLALTINGFAEWINSAASIKARAAMIQRTRELDATNPVPQSPTDNTPPPKE